MISIIITCFNESEIINEFVTALNKEISKINKKFEVIFVDNKSSDDTLEKIKNNIELFKNYKIISLSNYFGKESGILAGSLHSCEPHWSSRTRSLFFRSCCPGPPKSRW